MACSGWPKLTVTVAEAGGAALSNWLELQTSTARKENVRFDCISDSWKVEID
jgi:hypothetical protein